MGSLNIDSFVNLLGYSINNNCIENEQKRFIDKALGVLVNDGVYAYYVFCKAKSKDNNKKSENTEKNDSTIEKIFVENVVNEISKTNGLKEYFIDEKVKSEGKINYELFFRNLSNDLHKLLFFRDILERALIYARYHAKATIGDKND